MYSVFIFSHPSILPLNRLVNVPLSAGDALVKTFFLAAKEQLGGGAVGVVVSAAERREIGSM